MKHFLARLVVVCAVAMTVGFITAIVADLLPGHLSTVWWLGGWFAARLVASAIGWIWIRERRISLGQAVDGLEALHDAAQKALAASHDRNTAEWRRHRAKERQLETLAAHWERVAKEGRP